MYEMVQNAYKVTLVGAFIPLAAGLFWKRATANGALTSIMLGLATWGLMEIFAPEGLWPPQIVGLAASAAGMIFGSLALPRSRARVAQGVSDSGKHERA